MKKLSEPSRSHCQDCNGMGFTVGYGSSMSLKYICELCSVEFKVGDIVSLKNDIVVEFCKYSQTEGFHGDKGTVESVCWKTRKFKDSKKINIQYAVRLSRGNVVCVWGYELLKLDYLAGES